MNASVEVIVVEIIARNLPHDNGNCKSHINDGSKPMEANLQVSVFRNNSPKKKVFRNNLETSHCGSMLLVQVDAHFWNLALFNMQLVQHVFYIMVIPNYCIDQ